MSTTTVPFHTPKHALLKTGLPEAIIDVIFDKIQILKFSPIYNYVHRNSK